MPRNEQQAAFQEKLKGATEDIETGKATGSNDDLVYTMAKKEYVIKSKIQKVPPRLRKMQAYEKYYYPVVLPLGPVHHPHFDDNRLQESRNLKNKLATHFIKENKVDEGKLSRDIMNKIKDFMECYAAADLQYSYNDNDELTSIFLVDGCAVMCLIQEFANSVDIQGDDLGKHLKAMGTTINRIPPILRDLFLLENQLPFSLLLLICSTSSVEKKLIGDIHRFVARHVGVEPIEEPAAGAETQPPEETAKGKTSHLLDLYRDFLLFGSMKWHEPNDDVFDSNIKPLSTIQVSFWDFFNPSTFRNATELEASGIGFKRSKYLTDISFERSGFFEEPFLGGALLGEVKLPLLILSADTASIYLNLLAYEMCPDFLKELEFTSYICFMDSLIDQPEDVAVLRKANILRSHFGSDEKVSKFFNEIRIELEPNPAIYYRVKYEISRVYESKCKVRIAQNLVDQFKNRWTVYGFVVSSMALVLTYAQTWYAAHPNNPK